MKTASTALILVFGFASLGLWGCTQQKNNATASKIKELESRHAKLEEDYRVVAAASEVSRKKISQLEKERTELQQQVEELKLLKSERDQLAADRDNLVAERGELRSQLTTRTNERDNLHGQIVQFGKDLQGLLGRVEAAASTNSGSATVAIPVSRRSK